MLNSDIQKLSMQELLALIIKDTFDSKTVIKLNSMLKDPHAFLNWDIDRLDLREDIELQVRAGIELGRRIYSGPPYQRRAILLAKDAANLLMPELRYMDREYFKIVLLNPKLHLLGVETVNIGGVVSSIINPRDCFAAAIRHNATSLILAHNHPSGDPTPSPEDIEVTRKLKNAGRLLGINVLDHIIIGDGRWVSLNTMGVMG